MNATAAFRISGPMPLALLLLAAAFAALFDAEHRFAAAQDILRSQPAHSHSQNNNNQQPSIEQLANMQLPPHLAQLTPQQLHQLAQIRELQIQRQAQAQGQPEAVMQAPPIGLEANVAGADQPQGSAGQQTQPQPQPQSSGPATATNPANDSGAYNESGSELEGVEQSGGPAAAAAASTSAPSADRSAPAFEVNWNKCPQLDPSDSEKAKKTQVITKCLQSAPIPQNLTRENVEKHRETIAMCALKIEGWFDDSGNYKYDKAEAEIRGKKLEPSIELQVLKFHVACKDEAGKKFPYPQEKLIDQVQFYQACMDYYISIVCEIEVSVDQ